MINRRKFLSVIGVSALSGCNGKSSNREGTYNVELRCVGDCNIVEEMTAKYQPVLGGVSYNRFGLVFSERVEGAAIEIICYLDGDFVGSLQSEAEGVTWSHKEEEDVFEFDEAEFHVINEKI